MKDYLLSIGGKLPVKKLGNVADWLDIEQKDVIVSSDGLSKLQTAVANNPKKVIDLVKSQKFVGNLMKIISAFTGPSPAKSGFDAKASASRKKHKIEFSTFERALELMEDLLLAVKNPINVVNAISMDEFEVFVDNICSYMPRDILISTQELIMGILLRMTWACSQDKEYQKHYDILVTSMPSPFADCCKDEHLGSRQALDHMRPLLNKVNVHNPHIKSAEFHDISYDGGDYPKVQGYGAIDFCLNTICLTIMDDQEAEGVKIPYSEVVRLHFVDDGKNKKDSKSLDFVLTTVPESLVKLVGLDISTQHSQGVFSVALHQDADIAVLEECAKQGLASQEAANTQEMHRKLLKEVDTQRRKTSTATTRSSSATRSGGMSQVTPVGSETAVRTAEDLERGFEEAMSRGPSQEAAMEFPAKSVSPNSSAAAGSSPVRRSTRLETKPGQTQSQQSAWVQDKQKETGAAIAADAKGRGKGKRVLKETDTDDFEPIEEPRRKAAKPSPTKTTAKGKAKSKTKQGTKPSATGQPSRSESVSTKSTVPPATSPARMRRSSIMEQTDLMIAVEPEPGALSFAEADAAMKKESHPKQLYPIGNYISEKDLESEMLQEEDSGWDDAMAADDDYVGAQLAQPDDSEREEPVTASLLAEGRARAGVLPYQRVGHAGSMTTTLRTDREISYATKQGGRRVLRDDVRVQKMSTDLFSSEEEDEDVGSAPEPTSRTSTAQQRKRTHPEGQPGRSLALNRGVYPVEEEESSVEINEGDAMDYDEDSDVEGGASMTSFGGDALQQLARQVEEERAQAQRTKINRMLTAQADAAMDQVNVYLQTWMSNRVAAHTKAESEEGMLMTSFTANANAKREEMHRQHKLITQRGTQLSKELQERKDQCHQLQREIEVYERVCAEEEEAFKEDVKHRYETVASSVKKSVEEEHKVSKEARKRQKQLQQALEEA